jgi:flavin-dependent dehydrogenase
MTGKSKSYDAIVIGSGPAGTAAARHLVSGGMHTLLIEKERLPRQKICSGLLSPWAANFVKELFGEIPESAYGRPRFLKGAAFNHPSQSEALLMAAKEPIPNIWRAPFDFFLAQGSGADIRDNLRLDRIENDSGQYKVICGHPGRDNSESFIAPYVVGADGLNSRAIRLMLPNAHQGLPRISAMQIHFRGKLRIDPEYFNVFLHLGIGPYAWASVKDDHIHIGVASFGKEKTIRYYKNYLRLLKSEYGLEVKELILREGITGFITAPFNKFALGKGNFLVVGDAAGFVHTGGEGISCALASGDLAGEAIINAGKTNRKAIHIYSRIIKKEVDLCLDQFNLLRIFQTLPMPIHIKPLWRNNTLQRLFQMTKDGWAFIKEMGLGEMGINKTARRNLLYRLTHGHYPNLRPAGDKFVIGTST